MATVLTNVSKELISGMASPKVMKFRREVHEKKVKELFASEFQSLATISNKILVFSWNSVSDFNKIPCSRNLRKLKRHFHIQTVNLKFKTMQKRFEPAR